MSTVIRKTTRVKKEVPSGDVNMLSAFYCSRTGLLKGDGNSIFRAWYNQTHAYKNLNLKIVFGSLGFGKEGEEEIFFDLGGIDRVTFPDFINPDTYDRLGPGGLVWAVDLHCWLEDEAENIYDVFEPEWEMRASYLGKWISIIGKKEIRGKTAEELKRNHGIHYVKAGNKDTQFLLDMFIERNFRPQYDNFIRENPRLPV